MPDRGIGAGRRLRRGVGAGLRRKTGQAQSAQLGTGRRHNATALPHSRPDSEDRVEIAHEMGGDVPHRTGMTGDGHPCRAPWQGHARETR